MSAPQRFPPSRGGGSLSAGKPKDLRKAATANAADKYKRQQETAQMQALYDPNDPASVHMRNLANWQTGASSRISSYLQQAGIDATGHVTSIPSPQSASSPVVPRRKSSTQLSQTSPNPSLPRRDSSSSAQPQTSATAGKPPSAKQRRSKPGQGRESKRCSVM